MKVYSLSGKAESGKNLACDIIKYYYQNQGIEVCDMLFAKHLKQYAKEYFGWDGSEKTKPRELLQSMGTDIIRDKMNDPNFHARRLVEDINILSNYFDIFLISDCRFPNEVELTKDAFGGNVKQIRIERPNHVSKLTKEQREHKSETALDDYDGWDYKIINDGTLEEFGNKIQKILD